MDKSTLTHLIGCVNEIDAALLKHIAYSLLFILGVRVGWAFGLAIFVA